jgi:hypothetical protein
MRLTYCASAAASSDDGKSIGIVIVLGLESAMVALLHRVAVVRAALVVAHLGGPLAWLTIFQYGIFMRGSIIFRTEKRGRGRPRRDPKSIHLTLVPEQLDQLDAWIAKQDDEPTRPEAIRRLLAQALGKPK